MLGRWVQAHAWCMVTAFAILFPAGIIWARYYRVRNLEGLPYTCCVRAAMLLLTCMDLLTHSRLPPHSGLLCSACLNTCVHSPGVLPVQ